MCGPIIPGDIWVMPVGSPVALSVSIAWLNNWFGENAGMENWLEDGVGCWCACGEAPIAAGLWPDVGGGLVLLLGSSECSLLGEEGTDGGGMTFCLRALRRMSRRLRAYLPAG